MKPIVLCPQCQEARQVSQVYDAGSSQTAIGHRPYWDEQGRRHVHNPNRIRWSFRCTNGHSWTEDERFECPTCGVWQK
jgi:hypothetical protein